MDMTITSRIPGRMVIRALTTAVLLVLLTGCGEYHRYMPPEPMPQDNFDISEPAEKEYEVYADLLEQQLVRQAREMFDLSRQARNVSGNRKQAYNVNAFDGVDDSSWFTNRNEKTRMSLEETGRGPDTGAGPDRDGKWTVVRAKTQGVTPGFTIRDREGTNYLIKFDPVGYPELATGAEVVSTKLLHAAGYFVPENYVTWFRPGDLVLDEGVKMIDEKGRKRLMTESDLDGLLSRVESMPDGRIRALASRYLPGSPVGPFKYTSVRNDDPNDIIPHKHRRELRGLRVIAAWLNHVDTKSGNSLDSYVSEGGRSFIRHYLIDFGTTLGSAAHSPQTPKAGHENQIDLHAILWKIFTLGLYVPGWEREKVGGNRSVGYFESTFFDPGSFKFSVPNAAFESCTDLDGFWGARIVMSFTDEQLEAAVAAGKYSDSEAAGHILRVLKERRDKTGRYWFSRVNPLDRFRLAIEAGRQILGFDDLAVEYGFEDLAGTDYIFDIRADGVVICQGETTGSANRIPLPDAVELYGDPITDDQTDGTTRQIEVRIYTVRNRHGAGGTSGRGEWIKVYIDHERESGYYRIAGLVRED